MRKVEQLYALLESGPTPACDEILTAGLALAEPAYFDELVGVLIRRRNEAAWGGLIEHWHRLTFDVQEILQSDELSMLGGISRCMRGNPDARYHALVAFEQVPRTGAAYLLPLALRDPAARVRETAARCFRLVAELHFDHLAQVQSGGNDVSGRVAEEHEQMLAAVHEVLATFDVHLRVELVEACLWFAAELGGDLWDRLNRPRTRLARVVAARLEEWNSPRMAAFLLLALRHPEWRTPAQKMLREWDTATYCGPLLRNTHLLADPETASGVAVIRSTAWIGGDGGALMNLPPVLRPCVPPWIARLGISDSDRLKYLAMCARRGDTDTQAAAVAALATLERGGATAYLRELANQPGQLGTLAQKALDNKHAHPPIAPPTGAMQPPLWTASATASGSLQTFRDSGGTPDGQSVQAEDESETMSTPQAASASDTVDRFLDIWYACRRAQGNERTELLTKIRDGADEWQTPLLRHAQSPDPRDRMQLLRVIDTPKLKSRLSSHVAHLLSDPVPAVRDLAVKVLGESAGPTETSNNAPRQASVAGGQNPGASSLNNDTDAGGRR